MKKLCLLLFFVLLFVVGGFCRNVKASNILVDKLSPIIFKFECLGSLDELATIVEAEATDGTYEQKVNVASCVLNRVKSTEWPDTIHGVIYQKGQFSPVTVDGRYFTVKVTKTSIMASLDAIIFGCSHEGLWFCTPTCSSAKTGFHSKLPFIFSDGMHNYYK